MPTKPIGQSMIEANLISSSQLDELLQYQRTADERMPLGRLSVELGFVKDTDLVYFLAIYFNVPYVNLEKHSAVRKEILDLVPEPIARRFNVFPLAKEDDTLTVAISDPLDLTTLENLKTVTSCRIKAVLSPLSQIKSNIQMYYTGTLRVQSQGLSWTSSTGQRQHRLVVSSLVKLLLSQAIEHDVKLKIFFRIDKKLEKVASYPKPMFTLFARLIKKTARLNDQVSDTPQAGWFTFRRPQAAIEVGVSVFPTLWGESIVLEVPRSIGWFSE
jgi:type II secretory ATPase GspE/PulE/Tfp pilus assembly ATPase PilB-like protein